MCHHCSGMTIFQKYAAPFPNNITLGYNNTPSDEKTLSRHKALVIAGWFRRSPSPPVAGFSSSRQGMTIHLRARRESWSSLLGFGALVSSVRVVEAMIYSGISTSEPVPVVAAFVPASSWDARGLVSLEPIRRVVRENRQPRCFRLGSQWRRWSRQ